VGERRNQYRPLTTRLLSHLSCPVLLIDTNLPAASSPYDFPAMFGKERLDALDRQMLETICTHSREGQSFNKLVEEVKPFASRSTFAFRAKRL
jgi:hypothetical protein